MSAGYRAVQSTHAAINFVFEHPGRAGPWWKESNYLVQLEVSNEKELKALIQKLENNQLYYSVFREPDIGNQITAVAIEPSILTQKLVKKLPLLFKNENYDKSKYECSPQNNGNESQSGKLYTEDVIQEKI